MQHARCIVAAAPFLPDTMYICSAVYLEDRGLPIDHLDLLPDMESLRSDISSHGCAVPLLCIRPSMRRRPAGGCLQQGRSVAESPCNAAQG